MDRPRPWWERLLEVLASLFAKEQLERAGATPAQLAEAKTVLVPLGSGYSVEEERTMDVAKLRRIGEDLIADPALVKHDVTGDGVPETFCNIAVQRAARAYGYPDLDGMTANLIAKWLAAGMLRDWRPDTAARAVQHAQRGGLAIAAKQYPGNGHVALIAPEPLYLSGSWGRQVPMLYNVGKRNGLMPTSEAFPVAKGEPAYYVYGETA